MLTDRIQDLITAFTEAKKQPGYNKKAINKTVARLEEAMLWSKEVITPGQAGDRISLDKTAPAVGCICKPGMTDKNCPVHKTA